MHICLTILVLIPFKFMVKLRRLYGFFKLENKFNLILCSFRALMPQFDLSCSQFLDTKTIISMYSLVDNFDFSMLNFLLYEIWYTFMSLSDGRELYWSKIVAVMEPLLWSFNDQLLCEGKKGQGRKEC